MAPPNEALINPILPKFIHRMDPQFVEIYTKHQGWLIIGNVLADLTG
jgi:hypothetical protein